MGQWGNERRPPHARGVAHAPAGTVTFSVVDAVAWSGGGVPVEAEDHGLGEFRNSRSDPSNLPRVVARAFAKMLRS